ncbi:MAG: M23 family metallopeptidase [Actinomycetota bacterium]|nr:M23 family metallopeptidase [Actinomycetota bacterium]
MPKVIVSAAAAAAALLAVFVGIPLFMLVALLGSASGAGACGPQFGGPLVHASDLSPVQTAHAAAIVAAGARLQVPTQGVVVALAAASQESEFLNYANDGLGGDLAASQADVSRSLQLPHDAVGSDHGSVGIFQQQYPWWGTLEQLMDPSTSADKFFAALLMVPGWETMPVTVAAQAVEHSAYPDAYADDEPLARELVASHAGATDTGISALCGTGLAMDCPPTGLAAENGLTPDALRVLRCVQQQFGDHIYLGVGSRPDNASSDHPSGRAVDIMIAAWETPTGNAEGWQIARWVVANAAGLGVKYVIFDAKTYNVMNAAAGWVPYSHPSGGSSPTDLHRNHVHVSVYGNAAGGSAAVSAAGWTLPIAPGSYILTSGYGPRPNPTGPGTSFHAGLDFAAPAGTPIRSAATGLVTFAGVSGGYGNLVIIRTGNVEVYYGHQIDAGIRVVVGQQVVAGQQIGAVGSTGDSTGNHLHFEVRVNGASTDPVAFLRQYGVDPGNPPS